ncbi:MAG: N-acetyltransferase, partial [Spirochaetota bacterium]|nr:N-acetyltransferase [Spirochaetota bacterium]
MKTLETDRLILREWKLSDSADQYDYGKSELVGPSAGWKPQKSEDESIEIIKMFLRDGDVLAVELKVENKV